MSHVKSSITNQLPRDPNFKPPKTKEDFDRLGYKERVQLQREHPALYEKFATRQPWERH